MTAPNSPGRTTQVSSASVMSFSGPAARACPAAEDADGDEGFVAGCEIHTQEALLTPAALRSSAKQTQSVKLTQTQGDKTPASDQVPRLRLEVKAPQGAEGQKKVRKDQALSKEVQKLWVSEENFRSLQRRKDSAS